VQLRLPGLEPPSSRSRPALGPAAKIAIRTITLFDAEDRQDLDRSTRANPRPWSGNGYAPWSEVLEPSSEVKATYDMTAPKWATIGDSYQTQYRLTVTIENRRHDHDARVRDAEPGTSGRDVTSAAGSTKGDLTVEERRASPRCRGVTPGAEEARPGSGPRRASAPAPLPEDRSPTRACSRRRHRYLDDPAFRPATLVESLVNPANTYRAAPRELRLGTRLDLLSRVEPADRSRDDRDRGTPPPRARRR